MSNKFIIAFLIIVGMLLVHHSRLAKYFSLTYIIHYQHELMLFVKSHFAIASLLFIMLYIAIVACSVPISNMLTIAGGYFFGIIPSVIFSNIGATMGALVLFFVFRHLLADMLRARYSPSLKHFSQSFKEHGAYYLLFLQLLPITPFGFITILSAITNISPWTFYWTTAIGIVPGSLIYAFTGEQMRFIQSPENILSLPIIIALTLLALLALLPMIIGRIYKTQKKS